MEIKHKGAIKIDLNEEKQAFDTHYNYSDCLKCLTNGTSLKFSNKLSNIKLPDLDKKKNLINLTLKSLEDEYSIVQQDKDYSYASTSWLPVKTYYLLFNLMLTVEYIFKIQESVFNYKHVQLFMTLCIISIFVSNGTNYFINLLTLQLFLTENRKQYYFYERNLI